MVAPPLPSHARQDRPAARCELAFFAAPRLDPGMFVQAADWPPAALAGLGEGGDLLRDDFPPPGELISAETAPGAAGLAAGPDDPLAEVLEPLGSGETRFEARWRIAKSRIRGDHGGYYSARTCARLAYGLAFGSILANTSLDQDFQDWYQDDVRSEATDDLADWLNPGLVEDGLDVAMGGSSFQRSPASPWPTPGWRIRRRLRSPESLAAASAGLTWSARPRWSSCSTCSAPRGPMRQTPVPTGNCSTTAKRSADMPSSARSRSSPPP